MKHPLIYNYHDYRIFLKDLFAYLKVKNSKFSYRFLAMRVGFSSPSYFKLVVDGKRNLTIESINKLSGFFKFKKQEREYFENLVFMNQASSNEVRDYYYQKILSLNGYVKVNTIARAGYDYFSKWYYPAIRELVVHGGKKMTPEEIAAILRPKIRMCNVARAIQTLEDLGLIKKDKNGYWRQCNQHITTEPEVRSFVVAAFHKEMLRLASESIERHDSDQRDISALTLSMDSRLMPEIKDMMATFRKQIREFVSKSGNIDQVVQINLQVFPLTKQIK